MEVIHLLHNNGFSIILIMTTQVHDDKDVQIQFEMNG